MNELSVRYPGWLDHTADHRYAYIMRDEQYVATISKEHDQVFIIMLETGYPSVSDLMEVTTFIQNLVIEWSKPGGENE